MPDQDVIVGALAMIVTVLFLFGVVFSTALRD